MHVNPPHAWPCLLHAHTHAHAHAHAPVTLRALHGHTGGAHKFVEQDMDREYLPVWLKRLGYTTYFTGKFLNQFGSSHVAKRWGAAGLGRCDDAGGAAAQPGGGMGVVLPSPSSKR